MREQYGKRGRDFDPTNPFAREGWGDPPPGYRSPGDHLAMFLRTFAFAFAFVFTWKILFAGAARRGKYQFENMLKVMKLLYRFN